jgi:hypothetical protein
MGSWSAGYSDYPSAGHWALRTGPRLVDRMVHLMAALTGAPTVARTEIHWAVL